MENLTNKIFEAQDFLKKIYGESNYKLMIKKMQEKTTDIKILVHIANDKNMSTEIRLIAMASIGE